MANLTLEQIYIKGRLFSREKKEQTLNSTVPSLGNQKPSCLEQLLWNTVLCRNCTCWSSLCFKFLTYFSLVAGLLSFWWHHMRTIISLRTI